MAGSFSRLPLEILVIILQYASDLPSIYKFICASASANAAFRISPAPILDNAIKRSIPEFKHLARMVAILGSFLASSAHPSFEKLISKYKNLPKHVLTTGPASSVFTDTLGSRYLVLTAYRIETLGHICFVSLLQNIHEVIWPTLPTEKNSHFYPIKQSKNDSYFQEAAWWSPSWAEKTRITRALWKLMIYWNMQAICPALTEMDDYRFSRYSEKIQQISPCIGPDLTSDFSKVEHEVEEMKCVLAATQELLDYPHDLFTLFTSRTSHKFRVKKWASSTIFKETLHWKFEEPKPRTGLNALHDDQLAEHVIRMNSLFREVYWQYWLVDRPGSTPKSDRYNPQFPDYLGLCIWDYKRLGYLGLAQIYDKCLDPCLGPPRCPNNSVFTSAYIPARWDDLFMREVTRLPGGQLRESCKDLEMHIQEWKDAPYRHQKADLEDWRKWADWSLPDDGISHHV